MPDVSRPCEPVALRQLCALLAHELRSPLSVLQGYIRLLQRTRGGDDPESAMLGQMLEATGRLAAVARHASELAACGSTSGADLPPPFGLDAFCDLLVRSVGRHQCAIDASMNAVGPRLMWAAGGAPLVAAVLAVADAVARAHTAPSSTIHVLLDLSAGRVRALVRPTPPRPHLPARHGGAEDLSSFFTQGGVGLSLALASHVLASVAATIERTADGSIALGIPIGDGAAI